MTATTIRRTLGSLGLFVGAACLLATTTAHAQSLPTLVVLNMADDPRSRGGQVDTEALAEELSRSGFRIRAVREVARGEGDGDALRSVRHDRPHPTFSQVSRCVLIRPRIGKGSAVSTSVRSPSDRTAWRRWRLPTQFG